MTVTHHHGAMVRAVGAGHDKTYLDTAFAAPGAIFWDADGF
jgi:hypothetical protein